MCSRKKHLPILITSLPIFHDKWPTFDETDTVYELLDLHTLETIHGNPEWRSGNCWWPRMRIITRGSQATAASPWSWVPLPPYWNAFDTHCIILFYHIQSNKCLFDAFDFCWLLLPIVLRSRKHPRLQRPSWTPIKGEVANRRPQQRQDSSKPYLAMGPQGRPKKGRFWPSKKPIITFKHYGFLGQWWWDMTISRRIRSAKTYNNCVGTHIWDTSIGHKSTTKLTQSQAHCASKNQRCWFKTGFKDGLMSHQITSLLIGMFVLALWPYSIPLSIEEISDEQTACGGNGRDIIDTNVRWR